MEQSSNHINRLEIERIVDDFRINKYNTGLLALTSHTESIKNILNKPFRSAHYVIGFVTQGKVSLRINMFRYELTPENLLVISTSAIKEFLSVEDGTAFNILLFTENFVLNSSINQTYRDAFNFHTTQTHYFSPVTRSEFSEIHRLFEILKNTLQQTEKYPTSTLLFFTMLNKVAELLSHKEKQKETKNRKSELVIKFFRLLPKYINQHRNVSFYADSLNITPRYLSTTLKEKTGKTALVLIAEMVIQEAFVLLSNPQISINEVAQSLGFPDQFTFSKYFKQYGGITPSAYRKQ